MRLTLLGGLALEPTAFTRPKPLLLLAYLSLEGPRSRREVAELFWQGSKDPMQGLRMALLQLNKEVPNAIQTDEKKVWTELPSDLAELQAHLKQENLEAAWQLYQGTFAEGFDLHDAGEELEEWIFETRESVAGQMREVLLELAEQDAANADYSKAASRAEEAYLLRFAPEPDGALLSRVYTLLRADENSQADSVAKEARAYGLELALTPQAAKQQVLALTASALQPLTLKRRATDFSAVQTTEATPQTIVLDHATPHQVVSNQVVTNSMTKTLTDIQQALPSARPRSMLWRLAPLFALLLGLGLLLAFFTLRPRMVPVVARDSADDADVALGDNYFCPAHSNLFLSSSSQGQSTALRFRDIGIPKPDGKKITIQSALILFTSSEHIPDVPQGSGFVVKGLFDSSPWLVNPVCEQKHPAAGDNFVSRTRTKTSVTYQPLQWNITEQNSVDVTAIVQEMVDSPDWTGDNVAFAIDKLPNSTADLKAYSNEGGILLKDLRRQPQFVVTFATR